MMYFLHSGSIREGGGGGGGGGTNLLAKLDNGFFLGGGGRGWNTTFTELACYPGSVAKRLFHYVF